MEDEKVLKFRIERHQQKIFALVLYLIGGDKNKAYDIAVASFVEAIRLTPNFDLEETFLTKLANAAIIKSQGVKVIPTFDESDFKDLPTGKQKSLSLVGRALHLLPFETKSLLLLRDQLHLPYKCIADIFKISESDARAQMSQVQLQFRDKIAEVLSSGR